MHIRHIALFASVVLCVACAAPKVDGSSDESFKGSVEKVRDGLPEKRRAKFDAALMGLAFENLDFMKAATLGASSITSDMRAKLNGKSADEIIGEYEKVEADRAEKERLAAVKEREELIKERTSAEAAKAELGKFVVERSRFSIDRSGFMAEPLIQLRVRNGTPHAISRAFFRGRIVSPGRSVPWLEEDFNYSIQGGLEPGEVVDWRLKPNMFSNWGSVNAPADAGLEVAVVRLDGPDGKTLFDAELFTAEDQTRLAALEKQLRK